MQSTHEHLRNVQRIVLEHLSPFAALNVYKAFAVLNFCPAREVHDALFDVVMKQTGDMKLSDIVSLLQARFMIGLDVDQDSVKRLSTLICSAIKQSKKRNIKEAPHVVQILGLLSRHGIRNHEVLSEIEEFLKARIKGLGNSDLVSLVASMKKLDNRADKLFDAVVLEVLHRGPDRLSTADLARLAASLTEIKHFDVMTDVLMDGIALICQKRIGQIRFEEMVDFLWAFAHHMHFHHDAKLLTSLSTELVAELESTREFSGEVCAKLSVVATSDLGQENICKIMEAVSRQLPSVVESLSKQEVLAVATCCRKARFICSRLMGSLSRRFEELQEQLSLSDLARVLNNFATSNYNPGDKLLDLAIHRMHETSDLSPTETSRLIWSLAFFNKLTVENSRPLFDHLKNFSRSNFNALDTQKLLLTEKLILLLAGDPEEEAALIPEPLRSELTTMWRDRIDFTRSVSPFQQEVSRALSSLSVSHEPEALIDNGDISVDFLLYLGESRGIGGDQGGNKIILECDGPRRRSINPPYVPLGQTETFKKLLKAQGWRVVIIDQADWKDKSTVEREQSLKEKLKLQ